MKAKIDHQAYEMVDEFPEMCGAFIAEKSESYGQLDPKWFRMTLITNKDRPSPQHPLFKLVQLSGLVEQFCNFRFVVVTWQSTWREIGEAGRRAMVAEVLRSACSPL